LSIYDCGLDLSQVRHDVLALLLMLDLLRLHLLLLFSLLLILEHLFQLGVGGFVLLLQLLALDGQRLLHLLNLLDSLGNLVQTDIQM